MTKTNIQIRETNSVDFNTIMLIEERAFGSKTEAKLTANLLSDKTAEPYLSLMAFDHDKAIGHILFTRVYLDKVDTNQPLMHILAPLAVIPEYQRQGIGGALISEGLRRLTKMESQMVFVLGHAEYSPKFGFIPDAKKIGFSAPYPILDEYKDAWMIQSLNLKGSIKKGNVVCSNELNKPEHWIA